MKIVTILGARPQFIKAGSVSREIVRQKKLGADLEEIIVHTGQHYDANMSDVFFEEMQIPKPNYFLGIGGKSHGTMTGQMIEKIEEVNRILTCRVSSLLFCPMKLVVDNLTNK